MANYATLKAAIQQVVKTNGDNEITGALLQQSLIAMINSLGGYYQFAGIATPSTNPGTPDQNVMYFASTSGTYTNFGGIVVNEGEFCALCWNGSWIKRTTGAATVEQVTALGRKVDELALGKFYGFFPDASDLPAVDAPGYAYVGASSPFAIYVFENGVWHDSGSVYGPAEGNGEDIDTNEQGKLQFANRPTTNGMGYKILRRDKTFASQVGDNDTIYEIRYDFDLGGASVTIPARCVLKFDGGSIKNGTVFFNQTGLLGSPKILCDVLGKLDVADITWFGAIPEDNTIDCATIINKAQSVSARLIIPDGTFFVKSAIIIDHPNVIDWFGTLSYIGSETDIRVITIKRHYISFNMAGSLSCESGSLSHLNASLTNIIGLTLDTFNYGEILIGEVLNFNTGVMCIGDGGGFANNKISIKQIINNNIGLLITQDNGGWANENLFIGGKIGVYSSWDNTVATAHFIVAKKIYGTDTYNKVNSLCFIKLNLESSALNLLPVILENAEGVMFEQCRYEGITTSAVKLYGNCRRIFVSSAYGTDLIDYSDITYSTTHFPISLFGGAENYKSVAISIAEHVVINGVQAIPQSLVYGMSLSTAYGLNKYNIVDYNSDGDYFSNILISLDLYNDNQNKVIGVRVPEFTSIRNYIYVAGYETHDGAAVDQSKVLITAGLSLSGSGKYYQSGTRIAETELFVDRNIKRLYIGFRVAREIELRIPNSVSIDYNYVSHLGDTRPTTYLYPGFLFFDTTLGKTIVWNGTAWVNIDGTGLS